MLVDGVKFVLEGKENVLKQIKSLDDKLTIKKIRRAFRIAMAPLVFSAKDYAKLRNNKSKPTGNLSKSISFINGRSRRFPTVYVGPKVKKYRAIRNMRKKGVKQTHYNTGGWYGHFVEYGIAQERTTKGKTPLGGKKRKKSNRGTTDPKPFMMPAIKIHHFNIKRNVTKALVDLVEKQLK